VKLRQIAGATDAGRVRRRNEDAFVCAPPLFAVADGMGGAQAGEIASRLAANALRDELAHASQSALPPEARLRSVIQEANRRIYARAADDPRASGMGTTVTAALLVDGRVSIGHVGDSRAYRLRDGVLAQLTDDHSLVADLVRSGRLTPEEAELHPQRSVITRALGTDAAVSVDSFTVDALPGDVFLLCSDGLTTMVDEDAVVRTVLEADTLEAAARALVEAANRGGGEDNITVVLFSVEEGDPADEDTFSDLVLPDLEPPSSSAAVAEPLTTISTPGPAPASPERALPAERRRWTPPARRGGLGRGLVVVLVVLAVFAGVAALALWGLSRAHFVGAGDDGRVVVYQGVPWRVLGIDLYREIRVSTLLAAQLTPEERAALFDHSLVSESEAMSRVAVFEREATP
jgi:protein phosphatase